MPNRRKRSRNKQRQRTAQALSKPRPATAKLSAVRHGIFAKFVKVGGILLALLALPGLWLAWVSYTGGEEQATALQRLEEHQIRRDEEYRDLFRGSFPGVLGDSLRAASAAEEQGNFEEALDHLKRAGSLARTGDEKVNIHIQLGNLYENSGQKEKALIEFEEAARLAPQAADGSLRASAWASLANQKKDRRLWREAEDLYLDSLELFTLLDDKIGKAKTLHNLGDLAHQQGQIARATELFQESIVIKEEVDDVAGQVNSRISRSRIYSSTSRNDLAENELKTALALANMSKNPWSVMAVNWDLAHFHRNIRHNYANARTSGELALQIARQLGRRYDESEVLGLLGYVARSDGRLDDAEKLHFVALDVKRALNDRNGEGVALEDLAFVFQNRGDRDQTISYANEALKVAREVGSRYLEGAALSTLGVVYAGTGSPKEGLRFQCQSLRIYEGLGLAKDIEAEWNIIGNLHRGSADKLCRGIKAP